MTDQLMDDLTHEEHEALLLISEHAIAAPLSPAAQAVLDAFNSVPYYPDENDERMLAAALRAAADQVVPETTTPWNSTLALIMSTSEVRAKFLAIADELEKAND